LASKYYKQGDAIQEIKEKVESKFRK